MDRFYVGRPVSDRWPGTIITEAAISNVDVHVQTVIATKSYDPPLKGELHLTFEGPIEQLDEIMSLVCGMVCDEPKETTHRRLPEGPIEAEFIDEDGRPDSNR